MLVTTGVTYVGGQLDCEGCDIRSMTPPPLWLDIITGCQHPVTWGHIYVKGALPPGDPSVLLWLEGP